MELWKDIVFIDFDGTEYDYTGIYKISNKGRVYSHYTNKILSDNKDKDGYCCVMLSKNGKTKTFKIHRLVAFMFIGIKDKTRTYVNHKDELKDNNCVENLEWCNVSENNNHGSRQKRVHKKRRKTMSTQEWKDNNSGINSHVSKKVISVDVNNFEVKIYDTMRQACYEVNVSPSGLSSAVNRKSITKNRIWFKEGEFKDIDIQSSSFKEFVQYKKDRFLEYYKR